MSNAQNASRPVERCPECVVPGGYCAPLRCYCGHADCPASASYIPLGQVRSSGPSINNAQHAKSWADRKEETWLDRL